MRREGIERRLTDSLETGAEAGRGRRPGRARRPRRRARTARSLTFSQHLVVPDVRHQLRGAGPAQLLVQLALRRVRDVRRPGHARSRSTPSCVIPDARPRRSTRAPSPRGAARTRSTSRACSRRSPTAYEIDLDAPYRTLTAKQQKVILHGVEGNLKVKYKNRYGRTREYIDRVRGRDPVDQAPPRGRRERLEPRAVRGLHAPRAVPRLRRRPAQAGHAGRHASTTGNISEVCDMLDRRVGEVPRRARAQRARPDDRRAGHQGDQRPARVPARRRPRLPDAVALGGHAGRRRGAAHPPGQPDRLGAGRHAVRARRAVDRPAPARQPPADRHAHPAARPRQHGARRRARRGHDPRERLDRRHRPGRRRARRRRRLQRAGARGSSRSKESITGQYLSGKRSIPVPKQRRSPGGRVAGRQGRARAQPARHRRDDPARLLRRGHRASAAAARARWCATSCCRC